MMYYILGKMRLCDRLAYFDTNGAVSSWKISNPLAGSTLDGGVDVLEMTGIELI